MMLILKAVGIALLLFLVGVVGIAVAYLGYIVAIGLLIVLVTVAVYHILKASKAKEPSK